MVKFNKSASSKVEVILALLTTTICSVVLFTLSIRHSYNTGSILGFVQTNRATIAIFVHFISSILGALQLYVIAVLINWRSNLHLLSLPLSLTSLKTRSVLTTGRLNFNLPWKPLLLVILFWLAFQGPAALWNGAVTPVITTAEINAGLQIAQYPLNNSVWQTDCVPDEYCNHSLMGNSSTLGVFSYVLWRTRSTILTDSLSQASSRGTAPAQHKKLDNTGYVFSGRSYGVGASAGLSPLLMPDAVDEVVGANSFSFHETGYISDVSCIYNSSSALQLSGPNNSTIPWDVSGSLPNGDIDSFSIFGANINLTLMAIGSVISDTEYMYGFLGGGPPGQSYLAELNNIQCSVNFTLADFLVDVNTVNLNVIVTPTQVPVQSRYNIDPTTAICNNSFNGISYLSRMLTTEDESVFGDAFFSNIFNVYARSTNSTSTSSSYYPDQYATSLPPEDILVGVSEGLEVLLDGFLGGISAAQIMLAQDVQFEDATAQINIVQLGQPVYSYVTFGINTCIVVLFCFEALRTRFWFELPRLDALDLKSAILGTSVAVAKQEGDVKGLLNKTTGWMGDAYDPDTGGLKVKMRKNAARLAFEGVDNVKVNRSVNEPLL